MNTIADLQIKSTSLHEREMLVTVPKEIVDREFKQTVDKIQRVAQRPGFRPGKMPRNMVLSIYAPKIKQDLVDSLIEQSFDIACKKEEVTPVSRPQVTPVSEVSFDKPFTYSASFQVKPKVLPPEYKGLNLELTKFTFDDADVMDELSSMREYMAAFVEPKDRKEITLNDLVQCESIVKVDGEIVSEYSHKDYSVPLFADNVPEDLKNALVGKKANEEAVVNYTMPSDHQDEKISGKLCEMHLTIKSFKERVLPELDDNFAKDISDKFTTLEEVKESIRLRFNITAKRRNEYYRQEAITKALLENNPCEVPPALVDVMAASLIERELKTVDEKAAKEMVRNHWSELRASVEERAQFRVKAELLFEALIESLGISATSEEISKKTRQTKDLSADDARYSVQVEKLLDIIFNEATVTVVEQPLFKKGS